MVHDFKKFPELTNSQLDLYYFESPHKQIFEDFNAECVEVIDGDTIKVKWSERDFPFKIRFENIAAPELHEEGGEESKEWLRKQILREEIEVLVSEKRVGKWGRLLGRIIHRGVDVGEMSILAGHSISWKNRNDGKIPHIESILERKIKEVENA